MVLNFFLVIGDDAPKPIRINKSPTLLEAIPHIVQAKQASGRRHDYVQQLRRYFTHFAKGRENLPLSAITAEDVEKWFADQKEEPNTRFSNMGKLSSLFGYARRRGWIDENPIDRIERIRIDRPVPKIFTVPETETIMRVIREQHPKAIPYLALAMFGGIRPEEVMSLGWEAIDLERAIVTINSDVAKTRRRRVVHLHANAVEWLRLGGLMPLSEFRYKKLCKIIKKELKIEGLFPRDCLRHSACSYWVAELGDVGKVATELGNSVSILQKHYLELVPKSEAEKFWNIRP